MFNLMKKFWKDESAQGATEYILLLVAVVAILVLFRQQINQQVQSLLGNLGTKMNDFSSQSP